MRICLTALAVVVMLLSSVSAADRPNIVFIIADDMGWSDLGCYGNKFIETPHIDRLAKQGVRFTDFYAGTPVCSSTRASIFSGQYAARVGITDFIPGHYRPFEKLVVPPIETALPKGIVTPGAALKQAGYATAYFGKWHLGGGDRQPEHVGFEVTERTVGAAFNAWRKEHAQPNPSRRDDPKRIDLLTDHAIHFVEQQAKQKDKPFFLTVSHYAVHIPIEADANLIEHYARKPKPDKDRINNARYAAMTQHLDNAAGRLMKQLDELGLAENTLVVFTSDNGGLLQTFTGVGAIVTDNKPLRDEKGTLYEGGIRVPLIVRWPGVVKPGGECDEVTISNDFMATFVDAAAAKDVNTQKLDGLSLLPLLRDPTAKLDREAIYFHYPHYHHSRPAGAARRGEWKLIEWFEREGDERYALYNLAKDIGETRDVSRQHADLVKELADDLREWRQRVGARMPTPNPKYDAARAEEWWSRRSNQPIDIDARRRRFENRKDD